VTKKNSGAKGEQQDKSGKTFCSQWFRHFKDGVYLDTWEPVETLPEGVHVAGLTAWRLEGGIYVEGYIWQLNGTAGSDLWAKSSTGLRRDRRF